MSDKQTTIKLIFKVEDIDCQLNDANERGYLSHVLVKIGETNIYPVYFYTLERLKDDLERSSEHGEPFIAETGMIVIKDITLVTMQNAVHKLFNEGYFGYLLPLTPEQLNNADPYHWPP